MIEWIGERIILSGMHAYEICWDDKVMAENIFHSCVVGGMS